MQKRVKQLNMYLHALQPIIPAAQAVFARNVENINIKHVAECCDHAGGWDSQKISWDKTMQACMHSCNHTTQGIIIPCSNRDLVYIWTYLLTYIYIGHVGERVGNLHLNPLLPLAARNCALWRLLHLQMINLGAHSTLRYR